MTVDGEAAWRGCCRLEIEFIGLLLRQKPNMVLAHREVGTSFVLLAAMPGLHCLK